MILHYLKIALRNLLKYKVQTLISLIGLSVGFVSFALSALWMNYEQSYDAFHKDADRIYATVVSSKYSFEKPLTTSSPLLADYLVNHFPEVEAATYVGLLKLLKDDQKRHWKMIKVDSTFTSIFPVTVLEGSMQFLYNATNEVAITDRTARLFFGGESPIGKELPLDKNLIITAVVQEWKGHSNYDFDVIARRETPKHQEWGYSSGRTLIRIAPDTDIDALCKKLKSIKVDMRGNTKEYPVQIIPITEYHYTYPMYNTFIRIGYVRLFCLVSLLIVLGALSNYLIIYLIRIRMRQREWALRKVSGASEGSLIALLMSEILLLLAVAVPIGFLLMELSLPTFKRWSYIREENTLFFYKETLIYMSAVAGMILLFAWGIWPGTAAFHLAESHLVRLFPPLPHLLPPGGCGFSADRQHRFPFLYLRDDETAALPAHVCGHGGYPYRCGVCSLSGRHPRQRERALGEADERDSGNRLPGSLQLSITGDHPKDVYDSEMGRQAAGR